MVRRVSLLAYDWTLIVLALTINMVGLITLRSASPANFGQQVFFSVAAISAAVLLQLLSRRQIVSWAFLLYGLAIVLLGLVLVVGREVNGAKAWFVLGPVRFQPSELAKLALILTLTRLLAVRPLQGLLDYILPGMLLLPLIGLIVIQPDLGGTLVLLAIWGGILFVRGLPWKHLLVGVALAVPAAYFIVWPNLKPYQQERILAGFDPERDPLGSGFQVTQSKIAIGSGGLFGKGYGEGTQTQLGFVPERQTDFIYSVLSEEWGFVGAVGLLALYALLFWRLAAMALECSRLEDRLIIAGVLAMLSFQVMVNIGVTLGLAPVTGLTLPLVSYGGSSLLTTYIALGLALLVHRDRHRDI
ncbi:MULTISPECIES: rod shape-determining protein RodA [unclassified Meiothermus]|uniref:rod shape-determining protein RodA n=1 Tax=unclassified Meiothermus TaxID=370471 RepID=UPI000D7C72D8|nr:MULTISPECIES: rod shape-determining protein RodA [unclassified Meiothermus]PZA06462.1 rod shape-determining protein RodA [Meiothermus sp. Pnk-1]RYM36271.1 rod shape-determining protein RodA [Meiothermus sp. PNK-Is4]